MTDKQLATAEVYILSDKNQSLFQRIIQEPIDLNVHTHIAFTDEGYRLITDEEWAVVRADTGLFLPEFVLCSRYTLTFETE